MTASELDRLAARLVGKGAHAVVAPGGDAARLPEPSQLVAIGTGPSEAVDVVDGVLVVVRWCATSAVRASFEDPATAATAVAAWRSARLVHDPDGIGAALVHHAHSFAWERIHTECERHVAHELVATATLVSQFLSVRTAGERRASAALRSAIVLRLTALLAVHHRLLALDELDRLGLVASVMGPEWARDLDIALGAERGAADFATLSLFAVGAARCDRTLSASQRLVIATVVDASEHAL